VQKLLPRWAYATEDPGLAAVSGTEVDRSVWTATAAAGSSRLSADLHSLSDRGSAINAVTAWIGGKERINEYRKSALKWQPRGKFEQPQKGPYRPLRRTSGISHRVHRGGSSNLGLSSIAAIWSIRVRWVRSSTETPHSTATLRALEISSLFVTTVALSQW
jgi:hypothetical protein